MPQMAPLSWLTLFLFFIAIFLTINAFNYFVVSHDPEMKACSRKTAYLNWKW
uniref:ATP synthase complex subunit 8 n=1 Tax=Ernobius pini TaxID=1587284 RepID=A0A343C4Q7_9COLE|nr:ATP synthase F0 subunit 8 [Ernobius pini]